MATTNSRIVEVDDGTNTPRGEPFVKAKIGCVSYELHSDGVCFKRVKLGNSVFERKLKWTWSPKLQNIVVDYQVQELPCVFPVETLTKAYKEWTAKQLEDPPHG